MNYYHVYLESTGSFLPGILYHDLSKRKLKKTFTKPFLKGDNLLKSGEIINNNQIKKVVIIQTNKPLEDVKTEYLTTLSKDEIYKNRGGSVLLSADYWRSSDIQYAGENVTDVFIKKAPTRNDGRFVSILKHPLFYVPLSNLITFLITKFVL